MSSASITFSGVYAVKSPDVVYFRAEYTVVDSILMSTNIDRSVLLLSDVFLNRQSAADKDSYIVTEKDTGSFFSPISATPIVEQAGEDDRSIVVKGVLLQTPNMIPGKTYTVSADVMDDNGEIFSKDLEVIAL